MYSDPIMYPMSHHICPMMQSPCWHCMMSGRPMEHCPVMIEEMKKYEYEMKKKVKFKRDEDDEYTNEDFERDGKKVPFLHKKPEVNIANIINVIEVEAPDIMILLKSAGVSAEACKRIIIKIAELTHKHMKED
jgi:hypothetical protein